MNVLEVSHLRCLRCLTPPGCEPSERRRILNHRILPPAGPHFGHGFDLTSFVAGCAAPSLRSWLRPDLVNCGRGSDLRIPVAISLPGHFIRGPVVIRFSRYALAYTLFPIRFGLLRSKLLAGGDTIPSGHDSIGDTIPSAIRFHR